MTTVYFVRHAQPNMKNHDDRTRELSEKGLRDRLLVTNFLQTKKIDAVLSSPYKRAVDTVSHFARHRGLAVSLVDDFRERRVGKDWIADFDAFCRRQWRDFSYKLPDGESLREVQDRNVKALSLVLREYDGRNVAIGSHGTALSTVIHYYNPAFGYADFMEIKDLMPWIVQFDFAGTDCKAIRSVNLFETAFS